MNVYLHRTTQQCGYTFTMKVDRSRSAFVLYSKFCFKKTSAKHYSSSLVSFANCKLIFKSSYFISLSSFDKKL